MRDEKMLAAMMGLPDPDLLTATKITDPIGAGSYYRADTVVRLLVHSQRREKVLRAALMRIEGWSEHSTAFQTSWGWVGVRDLYRGIARDAIRLDEGQP